MKIAFWGTPELTITILETLEREGLLPSVIITGPDRPVGRGMILTAPAPKSWAQERNIPVLQPETIDAAFLEELTKHGTEISVVAAYGKILPEEAIRAPKYGTLNVHYSLLPHWRGATPVETAILAGDQETGVCIQQMVFKLDAGDIHRYEKLSIGAHETAPALRSRLNVIGADLLAKTIKDIENGTASPIKQDESDVSRCGKIEKEDGLVDLNSESPIALDRKFRAYFGWPGIYYFIEKNGQKTRIKITDAKLEGGAFVVKKVVPEGKKEMGYAEFLRNTS